MEELQIFNFENQNVRTVEQNGEPWFVLTDVCKILEITNTRNTAKRLDADEKGVRLVDTPGGKQKITIINESGLYSVVLRSDKPQARPFRKWVTSEVLPTIRKTGTYKTDTYKEQQLEVRRQNAKIRTAQLLYKVAKDCPVTTYKQVLQAHITELLTGQQLLPLPPAAKRTYKAGQIGEMLGISAKMVGVLAKRHNLKTAEFGEWVWTKSASSAHECQSFEYYINVVERLKTILAGGAA